jgi:hypothetical protein
MTITSGMWFLEMLLWYMEGGQKERNIRQHISVTTGRTNLTRRLAHNQGSHQNRFLSPAGAIIMTASNRMKLRLRQLLHQGVKVLNCRSTEAALTKVTTRGMLSSRHRRRHHESQNKHCHFMETAPTMRPTVVMQ